MSAPTPQPVACEDRRRCGAEKRWMVESGTWAAGHSIGQTSCNRHLTDTIAHAARFAQPVRVLRTDATQDQLAEFFAARGPVPTLPKRFAS